MKPKYGKFFIISLFLTLYGCGNGPENNSEKPNILFILIDDMGYGDLPTYGNTEVDAPNINRLASEGLSFSQFYVNSPICSPSRVACITGQYPSRWGITSYVHDRRANKERGMKNSLDIKAPTIAREMKKAGYYTAHIGKWHMGGGRDIADVPLITEYGFDESVTQFEGLGERYLAKFETLDLGDDPERPDLEKQSAALGRGKVHWIKRENFTKIFVDRAIEAIKNARKENKPFYINVWPDDIHTPLEPPGDLRGDSSRHARFLGVMHEMDRQLGRLFDYIREDPELSENTLIVLTSDNGPDAGVNKAGNLKGHKTQIYEGGVREPFITWHPGVIPEEKQGTVDTQTVFSAIDLLPSFSAIAGVANDRDLQVDGLDVSSAITGKTSLKRQKALFWLRPPDRPGLFGNNDPDLAIRKGDYKLLMDVD
ncbi:sulfatase-like hydrolase/transferase [Sinomicrobium weinanense]|uniref:Sulfatase-like hydrolase/transferase n=1 Tax=Sinomicrobium weinanense TaxID=2842200 RepID=A0A926Q4I9_9FLAO|nr:sulfatase-like hydrolase/transferase [Sinomicrobium weinanense]MBC9798024.1 sulfatase-like hydrolase/transferase [Sinomicrobium weinanense]MBU3125865.1 sulfatase-like hydrolase/transferase [Sinomicrobium weinanense]